MKKIIGLALILIATQANAQQFINSGTIEFEMRMNNHKSMGEGVWADMFRDKINCLIRGLNSLNGLQIVQKSKSIMSRL